MRIWGIAALAAAVALAPGVAAAKKKAKAAKPTPTPKSLYGPPAPTPLPLLRAAGSCLGYEAGHFILLAEVGQNGRVFRIAPETVLHVEPRRGARLRLVYIETPEGPVAREVLPGPVPSD